MIIDELPLYFPSTSGCNRNEREASLKMRLLNYRKEIRDASFMHMTSEDGFKWAHRAAVATCLREARAQRKTRCDIPI